MTPAGLLHSDICGSKSVCDSPQLFAAYHVFLRPLMPRHSPCALCSLIVKLISQLFESCVFIRDQLNQIVVFILRQKIFVKTSLSHSLSFLCSIFKIPFSPYSFEFGLVGSSGLEPPTSRLSGVRSNHLSYEPMSFSVTVRSPSTLGGDEEDRTPDPLRAKQVLSQLSYTPIV